MKNEPSCNLSVQLNLNRLFKSMDRILHPCSGASEFILRYLRFWNAAYPDQTASKASWSASTLCTCKLILNSCERNHKPISVQFDIWFWRCLLKTSRIRPSWFKLYFFYLYKIWQVYKATQNTITIFAGPHSTVGNVSGYRCESDCRSRGNEFDPGPVPYFRGDWSWNNFYSHSPPSAESFKNGCCQLQAKVCARSTGYPLVQACPGKSVIRWTDRPAMTIAVDLGRKATKQTNKQPQYKWDSEESRLTYLNLYPKYDHLGYQNKTIFKPGNLNHFYNLGAWLLILERLKICKANNGRRRKWTDPFDKSGKKSFVLKDLIMEFLKMLRCDVIK